MITCVSELAGFSVTALSLNFQLKEDFNKGFISCLSTVPTSASQEEAINNMKVQSLPEYQYKKANLPFKTRQEDSSSSQDISPYIHEIIEFQKKNNKQNQNLKVICFGGIIPKENAEDTQKMLSEGCTKEELIIACLPYIDYEN